MRAKTARQGIGRAGARVACSWATWPLRLPDEQRRDRQPEAGIGEPEQERPRPQAGLLRDRTGDERGHGDGAVPGGLVDAHRKPASQRADQVDLHDHGRRPREPLVDPEQHVGEDDPAPRRRPDEEQRHRQPDEPAGDEDGLAPEPVRESARDEVGPGLGHPERDEERQGRGDARKAEDLGREQRDDRPLLADHPADERVDRDEQRELAEVLAQPQPDRCAIRSRRAPHRQSLDQAARPTGPLDIGMTRARRRVHRLCSDSSATCRPR